MRLPRVAAVTSAAAVAAVGLTGTSLAASGIIGTVAGTGSAGFTETGVAIAAQLDTPAGVAATSDGGFLIADTFNGRIGKVNALGVISTVAGGSSGGDGDSDSSVFTAPVGVAPTADGILVTDAHRVSLISPTGTVSRLAGDSTAGGGGDNGPPASARLSSPAGIAVLPSGGFVVADMGNHRIRKVEAGIITTVAGTGAAGFGGDLGPAAEAQLSRPTDVAVLPDGDLLVADSGNGRVRRVDAVTRTISTVAGGGAVAGDGGRATDAALGSPSSVAPAADGGFAVSDSASHTVRRVLGDGTIVTVAGTGIAGHGGDGGPATSAALRLPSGLAVDGLGRLLIADRGNHRIRRVDIDLLALPAAPALPGDGGATAAPENTIPATGGTASADGIGAPPAGAGEEPAASGDGGPASPAPAPATGTPRLGTAVVVAPVAGKVLVRRPGAATATLLQAGQAIPVGSMLDTRHGTIALTSALPGGRTQTGRFSGGRFSVAQARTGSGVTELVLRGPELGSCRPAPAGKARTAARRRKPIRRLWGEDKGGRFRTRGRNSVATVRGTRWLTEDTCAGTLTRVVEGAVDVYDVHRGVRRRVEAGRSLLVCGPAARPAAG